jgi:hypothetical protein
VPGIVVVGNSIIPPGTTESGAGLKLVGPGTQGTVKHSSTVIAFALCGIAQNAKAPAIKAAEIRVFIGLPHVVRYATEKVKHQLKSTSSLVFNRTVHPQKIARDIMQGIEII